MSPIAAAPAQLSNTELVAEVARLAQGERAATAALVAALVEFDIRKLYLAEGFPSLFAYCTQRMHLSEHAAYHRIEAARAVRRFPLVLERLQEGSLTLTAVGLLRPHLTEENHRGVLDTARHQSKRAIEELVARLHARPDVRASVRRLPAPRSVSPDRVGAPPVDEGSSGRWLLDDRGKGALPQTPGSGPDGDGAKPTPAVSTATPASHPAVIRALAPARYMLQMTVSAETHEKLRRAQDLLRHVLPNGDPAAIVERALTLLVEQLERTRCGATKKPRAREEEAPGVVGSRALRHCGATGATKKPQDELPTAPAASRRSPVAPGFVAASGAVSVPRRSRYIPAAVRRAVRARDDDQCTFVGTAGRCPERGLLEFHHREPFAAGGDATPANIFLRCRQHNQWEAEQYFGSDLCGNGKLEGVSTPESCTPDATTRSGPS